MPPGFAVTTARARRERRRDRPSAVAEVDAAAVGAPAYAALGDDPPVAVRSSAVAEDAADASFAGVQDTYLWIRGSDEVVARGRRCWASYFNAEAVAYRAPHAGRRAGMSVAVQSMVDARVAGVMFTLNPVSGDPSSIAIEASYGLGVTVVGGEVTPDSFLVSKVTREILRSEIGEKGDRVRRRRDGATSTPRSPRASSALAPAEVMAARRARRRGRAALRTRAGHRVGDRRRAALGAAEPRRDRVGRETAAARARRRPARRDRRHLSREAAVSDLTPEDVSEILRAIDEAGYDEFELETPRFTLRIDRAAGRKALSDESSLSQDGLVDVTAPMVGTVYRAPAPDAPPFVDVGSRVEVGAQLCIIEVMKLMNAVSAEVAGTVAEVCVESGSAVQYGDVLFRIRADG